MNKFKRFLRIYLYRLSSLRYLNRWVIFFSDFVFSVLITQVVVGGLLIYDGIELSFKQVMLLGLLSSFASVLALVGFRLYANVIRHLTVRGVWRIIMVAFLKVIALGILYEMWPIGIEERVLWMAVIADFFVTVVALLSIRILLLNVYSIVVSSTYKKGHYIWIYGTGDNSVALANGGANVYMKGHKVKGFITTLDDRKKLRLAGFPVYVITNEGDFKALVQANEIDGILFPSTKQAKTEQNRLLRYCKDSNLRVLVVPEMEEVKGGILHRSIREIKIEDLLGRDEIQINMKEIGGLLEGKVVMVTGAAGSIGSEICRQLSKFRIRKLICFDIGETSMHNLRLELEDKFPDLSFVPMIGDVRSRERLDYAFRMHHPQIVFHAAAYKHVPLMEENPGEAIQVNVYGTKNMADYAVKYNVGKFVMVSTDKAVNPTNIMGCSKRIAEIYVQSLSIAIAQGKIAGKTKFITTRFGNVLGSNGSVIPRFREQILNGGPVTVTHPDIIRYFMTIPEACRLVLEAGTMGNGGEIFIFEMGDPVKIRDLAHRMIELSGLKPDKDIQIVYTGLRPGEKLYEELLSNKENTKSTPHEKIRVAAVREYDYQEVLDQVARLSELSSHVDIIEMVKRMKLFVPEFKSQNSQFQKYDT